MEPRSVMWATITAPEPATCSSGRKNSPRANAERFDSRSCAISLGNSTGTLVTTDESLKRQDGPRGTSGASRGLTATSRTAGLTERNSADQHHASAALTPKAARMKLLTIVPKRQASAGGCLRVADSS